MLFNIAENEIQRGKVGVATTDLVGAYFSNLAVTDLVVIEKPLSRNFNDMFDHLDDVHIKKTCEQKMNMFGEKKVEQCQSNIYSFCFEECKKLILPVENILSYNCWHVCVETYKANKKISGAKLDGNNKKPVYDKGEKVDYMPDSNCDGGKNESEWAEAWIIKVEGEEESSKI